MILLDANVLLYAYVPTFDQHERAKEFIESTLVSKSDIVALSWQVITAFLRIGSNPRVFTKPFSMKEANERIDDLVAHPLVQIAVPTDKHWSIFSTLLIEGQATGDLVMDAHLAALAIEHGATLATTDRDFTRFSQLITINPMG